MGSEVRVCNKCGASNEDVEWWRGNLCKPCRRAYERAWRAENQEYRARHVREQMALRKRQRQQVISHYGGRCVCCGEAEPKFLCLDHVEGGGRLHRKTKSGGRHWKDIIDLGFPPDFQILCANCNQAKETEGGCPHAQDPGS